MSVSKLLADSPRITVLTGAGVSVDSGIPDFKTVDEVWKYDISREEAISLSFFQKNPTLFWKIYRELFESKQYHTPNDFHRFIAQLEKSHEVTVITQNVDGLHSAAGSSNVIEMHGSVNRVLCMRASCAKEYPAAEFFANPTPRCLSCGKIVKPDVCLFGESVRGFARASIAIENSDLIIVAGTALEVAPFNYLPKIAENSERMIRRLWINKVWPPHDYDFTDAYIGSFKQFLASS